jgi:nucleoside phosphorylase/CheY-like chemotaxis protein
MIKILIVEDNDHKLSAIKRLLTDEMMFEEQGYDVAKDIKAAKRLLMKNFYDLLILDLVLPLDEGDIPSPEKGARFMRDINSMSNLNPPVHIIGLTEFGEFNDKYEQDFNDNLWYLINYNATEINWQDKLKNLINHLLSIKNKFFEKMQNENNQDVAIITALSSPEFEYVLSAYDNWSRIDIVGDITKYYTTEVSFNGKNIKIVAACADHMGMTATTSLTTRICMHFKPKYIFMAGICAGVRGNDLNYGDIVIAEQSWDYGSGKMKEVKDVDGTINRIFEPDARPIQLSLDLVAKMNHFLRDDSIRIKIQSGWKSGKKPEYVLKAKLGPVASGAYVVASDLVMKDIKFNQRKLVGVEMEAYGLYYAAQHSPFGNTKPIMIKSICDFGDAEKHDEFQEYAAYTSAQFIRQFILTELYD